MSRGRDVQVNIISLISGGRYVLYFFPKLDISTPVSTVLYTVQYQGSRCRGRDVGGRDVPHSTRNINSFHWIKYNTDKTKSFTVNRGGNIFGSWSGFINCKYGAKEHIANSPIFGPLNCVHTTMVLGKYIMKLLTN